MTTAVLILHTGGAGPAGIALAARLPAGPLLPSLEGETSIGARNSNWEVGANLTPLDVA